MLKVLLKKETKYLSLIVEELIKTNSSKTEKTPLSTEVSNILTKDEKEELTAFAILS